MNNCTITDAHNRWMFTLSPEGITHFGLDSEGTGREIQNLLTAPATVSWAGAATDVSSWEMNRDKQWTKCIPSNSKSGSLVWEIEQIEDGMEWRLTCNGEAPFDGLAISLPMNPLLTASVLIPTVLDFKNRGLGPWLMVAPDFGHLLIECNSDIEWHSENTGARGYSSCNAPSEGLEPGLRGTAWLEAAGVQDFVPGVICLRLVASQTIFPGQSAVVRFRYVPLQSPLGIDAVTWQRIRRPYLNLWQPCGTWTYPEMNNVLANNVLSDPASCSLWFYSEPMLFLHEPVPGIDVVHLLRHSLDYWLDHAVSAQGHVNSFGKMYDLYLSTGATLLIAAWDYWTITGDHDWLHRRLTDGYFPVLHRIADYLLRRDVDNDGLIESIQSGNANTLREPDRADIWFEMMHFGWKNAWTNALAYRAFCCLAEMLEADGELVGAQHYRDHANKLRESYVQKLLGENGWFVSWISQDNKVHDYCHTFINGMAVAYGIVSPVQGREILSRVVDRTHSIGFTNWHLGVPGNLLPCKKADMIGPRLGIDGQPIHDHFFWPEDLTEEKAFGHRYPNGTLHPPLTWLYLLGLQTAGLDEEADRILEAMIESAGQGLLQNGIVNTGYGGAEHFYIDGRTCGYEGFLPESFTFLSAVFTRSTDHRARLLKPCPAVL